MSEERYGLHGRLHHHAGIVGDALYSFVACLLAIAVEFSPSR